MRDVAPWAVAGALGLPSLAAGKSPTTAAPKAIDGVTIDVAAGTLEARGAGAPDLRAPSAKVARVGAERQARLDAARRMADAVATLSEAERGCTDASKLPPFDRAALAATPRSIDWGSDGSVQLVLRISVASWLASAAASDGGVAPTAKAAPEGGKHRALVHAEAKDCARAEAWTLDGGAP